MNTKSKLKVVESRMLSSNSEFYFGHNGPNKTSISSFSKQNIKVSTGKL
jgi:hypothetical protein